MTQSIQYSEIPSRYNYKCVFVKEARLSNVIAKRRRWFRGLFVRWATCSGIPPRTAHSNVVGGPRQSEAAAWHRRVGYASVHALLLLAVEWRLLSATVAAALGDWALFAAALAASAALYYLQGSDPGFLTEGTSENLHAGDWTTLKGGC